MEHPRWGAINGIQTIADIPAGQEVYANYRYEEDTVDTKHTAGRDWYWELKRQVEKDERLKAKQSKNG